jgi:hypothetical protein
LPGRDGRDRSREWAQIYASCINGEQTCSRGPRGGDRPCHTSGRRGRIVRSHPLYCENDRACHSCACPKSKVVPAARVELASPCGETILSRPCMPFHHAGACVILRQVGSTVCPSASAVAFCSDAPVQACIDAAAPATSRCTRRGRALRLRGGLAERLQAVR